MHTMGELWLPTPQYWVKHKLRWEGSAGVAPEGIATHIVNTSISCYLYREHGKERCAGLLQY